MRVDHAVFEALLGHEFVVLVALGLHVVEHVHLHLVHEDLLLVLQIFTRFLVVHGGELVAASYPKSDAVVVQEFLSALKIAPELNDVEVLALVDLSDHRVVLHVLLLEIQDLGRRIQFGAVFARILRCHVPIKFDVLLCAQVEFWSYAVKVEVFFTEGLFNGGFEAREIDGVVFDLLRARIPEELDELLLVFVGRLKQGVRRDVFLCLQVVVEGDRAEVHDDEVRRGLQMHHLVTYALLVKVNEFLVAYKLLVVLLLPHPLVELPDLSLLLRRLGFGVHLLVKIFLEVNRRLLWVQEVPDLVLILCPVVHVELGSLPVGYLAQRPFVVAKDNLSVALKSADLDFDDFTNCFSVVADVFQTFIVLNYAGNPEVEAAEHDSALNVLYKSLDVSVDLQVLHIRNVLVDETIADAFASVAQNFVVKFGCALVDLSVLDQVVHDVLVKNVEFPHFLVDQRQELDVLRCVLDHGRSEGSLFPEFLIFAHKRIDFLFFGVDLAHVLLKQVIQAYVDIPVVVLLKKV